MRIKRESLLGVITTADQETQWAIWSTGTLGTVSHSHMVSRPKVVCVKVAHQGFEGRMSQPDPSSYFHIIQFFTRSTVLMEWWERTGKKTQILLELVSCPNVSQRIQEAGLLTQAMAFHHLRILCFSEWLVLVKNKMLLLVQSPSHCLACLSAVSIWYQMYNSLRSLLLQPCTSAALPRKHSKCKLHEDSSHTQSAARLILGQQFFWKAEGSQPLTIVGSGFILPCCPVFYGT